VTWIALRVSAQGRPISSGLVRARESPQQNVVHRLLVRLTLLVSVFRGAVWHFFRSPVTGVIGPTAPLREGLERAGFEVIIGK